VLEQIRELITRCRTLDSPWIRAHQGVPDSELWRRAAGHDGQPLVSYLSDTRTPSTSTAFVRTASWSTAEELTSVVFLEAWRRRRAVRLDTDSILPWLLAVANNAIPQCRPVTAPSPAPSGQAAPAGSMRMTLGDDAADR